MSRTASLAAAILHVAQYGGNDEEHFMDAFMHVVQVTNLREIDDQLRASESPWAAHARDLLAAAVERHLPETVIFPRKR